MEKHPDLEAIVKTVQLYFNGLYNSDTESLRQAFHPRSQVIGSFKGVFAVLDLEEFLGMVSKTPAPRDKGEAYDMSILSIDRSRDLAWVKVEDLYLGYRFTDSLTLLKIDGRWLIVNKTYRHDPKA